jgi:hypothetical protein
LLIVVLIANSEHIQFWRKVEKVIFKVTGAIPRYDDQKWSKMSTAS